MTSPIYVVFLLAVIAFAATETVVFWHRRTKGTWRDWPAGRSLMYLLLIIAFGFGYGVLNQFLGQYPARPFISVGLYVLFITALVSIRFTIAAEMRRGERRNLKTKLPVDTQPVSIVVASENKESLAQTEEQEQYDGTSRN